MTSELGGLHDRDVVVGPRSSVLKRLTRTSEAFPKVQKAACRGVSAPPTLSSSLPSEHSTILEL